MVTCVPRGIALTTRHADFIDEPLSDEPRILRPFAELLRCRFLSIPFTNHPANVVNCHVPPRRRRRHVVTQVLLLNT